MRYDAHRRLPRPLLGEVLHGGDAVHSVRRRSGFYFSLGGDSAPAQSARRGPFRALGDVRVYRHLPGWLFLRLEKRRSGLGTAVLEGEGRRVDGNRPCHYRLGRTEKPSGGGAAAGVESVRGAGGKI